MRRVLIILLLLSTMVLPVSANGIVAPEVPDDVESLFPEERDNFGAALLHILKEAISQMQPLVADAAKTFAQILGLAILLSLLHNYSGKSSAIVELGGVLGISAILTLDSSSLIQVGTDTIWQISQYGKLLLPVLAVALTAQGGTMTAATVYGATAIFDSVICTIIASVLVPILYVYLVLSIVNAVSGDPMLAKLGDMIKGLTSWLLKILLYVFVGYVSVSGIISGTADQTVIKATKLTLSGMIPVVGGIVSDASETILVSAGLIKNTVGIYGFLAIISIVILPFLSMGVNYLTLKISAIFAGIFLPKSISKLLEDFTGVLGLLLGMTGSVCVIQLISVVCFMKGMT